MKIKIAFLDTDGKYLSMLVSTLNAKYADEFELYSFTDPEYAMKSIADARINVLVASVSFGIDRKAVPESCALAFFTADASMGELYGCQTIGKYQRIENIYRKLIELSADNCVGASSFIRKEGDSTLITFSSPCRGTGTSTLAAACAIRLAAQGRSVFYLNLERFGGADVFFGGDTQNISKVIYALKASHGNQSVNLGAKIKSCILRSQDGVNYFAAPDLPLDMNGFDADSIDTLIGELNGGFDYIIVDIDFSISDVYPKTLAASHRFVWCSDGTDAGNFKLSRTLSAICSLEQEKGLSVPERVRLIYNKMDKYSTASEFVGINCVGLIPYTPGGASSSAKLALGLSKLDIFDKLL